MGVIRVRLAAILLAVLVSGCGGGDGGSGGGGDVGGGVSDVAGSHWNAAQPPPAETSLSVAPKVGSGETEYALRPLARSPFPAANRYPSAKKYSYKLGAGSMQEASATLATLESPGFAGHRVFGYVTLDGNVPAVVYEKGAVDAYSYRTSIGSGFDETTLTAQGAAGYVPMGTFMSSGGVVTTLYGKPSTSATTYGYIRLPYDAFANVPSGAFTIQLNSAGSQGGCSIYSGSTTALLIQRSNPSAGACQYEILSSAATMPAYVDQLNAQGVRGFVPSLRAPFDGEGAKQVYVRNTSQNATFFYYVLDNPELPAGTWTERANEFVDFLNQEGGKGGRSFYSYIEEGVRKTIFRMSMDCSGPICD